MKKIVAFIIGMTKGMIDGIARMIRYERMMNRFDRMVKERLAEQKREARNEEEAREEDQGW